MVGAIFGQSAPDDWEAKARHDRAHDTALEAAIDGVGRERVFDRAVALGWAGAEVPKFVWWGIVRELTPPPPLEARYAAFTRRLAEAQPALARRN